MADDVMIFPDTWEEFEKQYGFYDSKQAYMYGNTRLIPSFRVQQWLDHIDDTKQSQNNKMEQIAKMFGKKIGEPFMVYMPFHKCKNEAVFDAHGLSIKSDGEWHNDSNYLMWLLAGEAKIVEDKK